MQDISFKYFLEFAINQIGDSKLPKKYLAIYLGVSANTINKLFSRKLSFLSKNHQVDIARFYGYTYGEALLMGQKLLAESIYDIGALIQNLQHQLIFLKKIKQQLKVGS